MKEAHAIIIEESNNQVLYSITTGFSDTRRKNNRLIMSDKIIGIINSTDYIEEDYALDVLYKEFFIETEQGYILCYGDFRKFSKLILTGGFLNKEEQ